MIKPRKRIFIAAADRSSGRLVADAHGDDVDLIIDALVAEYPDYEVHVDPEWDYGRNLVSWWNEGEGRDPITRWENAEE